MSLTTKDVTLDDLLSEDRETIERIADSDLDAAWVAEAFLEADDDADEEVDDAAE